MRKNIINYGILELYFNCSWYKLFRSRIVSAITLENKTFASKTYILEEAGKTQLDISVREASLNKLIRELERESIEIYMKKTRKLTGWLWANIYWLAGWIQADFSLESFTHLK